MIKSMVVLFVLNCSRTIYISQMRFAFFFSRGAERWTTEIINSIAVNLVLPNH